MADRVPSGDPTAFGLAGDPISASNNDLPLNARAIVCTTAGNVTIVPFNNEDGTTITFTGCPVGFSPPYVVRRVTALTGSWATVAD
jgi:hypothetical protein